MRVSLFVLSFVSIATVASAVLFNQQPSPPWNPRILQGWAFPTTAFTYNSASGTPTTVAAGTTNVIAWGGGTYNDTYISTDSATSWTLIGGTAAFTNATTGKTGYVTSPHPATFNCDDSDCCKTYDAKKNIYYTVDQFDVFTSTNGLDWTTVGGTEFAGRQSAFCLTDPSSDLFIIGGQNTTGDDYENDVWMSSNQATSFGQVATAPWSQRDSQNGWVHQSPLGVSVLYAIGGHAEVENARPNEVWVSSDNGASWRLLGNGQFLGRDHFGAGITSSGIMLVVGGKLQAENTLGSHLGENDVWASLDGGVTFGSCGLAEFPVRQDHRFAIDTTDYLYVSGGTSNNMTGPTATLNDVWRSAVSWTSPTVVAAACGLTVPACGVGLRCWPNATTIATSTIGGVSYPVATAAPYSCPCTSTSNTTTPTTSSSSTGVIGIVSSSTGSINGAVSTSHFNVAAAVVLMLLSMMAHLTL